MYCRKCGNKISDTDIYCQFCGTLTGQAESPAAHAEEVEGTEEIIFNPPYENHRSHYAERELRFAGEEPSASEKEKDLREFISESEIKETHSEQRDDSEKPLPAKGGEFTWNVHEFPAPGRKTEEVEFNWNLKEFDQTEQKEEAAASFEEELFREITEGADRIKEQNIDRFFTFSRKNEEFQKLLDKEYEKLNTRFEPVEAVQEQSESAEAETFAAEPAERGVTEDAQEPAEEPSEELTEIVSLPEEPAAEAPQNIDALLETLPETDSLEEPETETSAEPNADHLAEMAQARAQFLGADLIKDNDSIKRKLEPAEQDQEPAPTEQDKTSEPEQGAAEIELTETEPEETAAADQAGETPGSAEEVQEPAEERPGSAEEVQEPAEEAQDQPQETPDWQSGAAEEPAKVPDLPEEQAGEPAEEVPAQASEPDETAARLSMLYTPLADEEKEPHKKTVGQIALMVIAVIIAIEIIILGISYFAPNSTAALIIDNAQTQIIQTVSGWADGIKDQFSGKDANEDKASPENNDPNAVVDNTQNGKPAEQQENAGTKPSAPDPKPAADKNALVASQLGSNKNIEQVKANETLTYQNGKDYGKADLNSSKPIVNNIWQTPEGKAAVYYDQSIVGTIISFDSQWIDYVNGGGKGVLDLLKKDSEAYRKTADFSKIGKIKEAFKLLEIGEIRQGANGFYVWAHEELQITENGKTAVKKYNWIYYLEPVEGKMKIVNYFKF